MSIKDTGTTTGRDPIRRGRSTRSTVGWLDVTVDFSELCAALIIRHPPREAPASQSMPHLMNPE